MRRLLLLLAVSCALVSAQTASFPGAIVTDAHLKIAANRIQSTLLANMGASDTAMVVANGSGFVANMLVTVDNEIINVCSVAGNILSIGTETSCPNVGGRGQDGTSAATHTAASAATNCSAAGTSGCVSAYIDAWHHNVFRAEVEAIETALGINMANVPGATGPVPASKGGTGLASCTGIPYGAGTAAMSCSGNLTGILFGNNNGVPTASNLTGLLFGNGASPPSATNATGIPFFNFGSVPTVQALTGVLIGQGSSPQTAVSGNSGQVLRRNIANTGYEMASLNRVVISDFAFAAQTCNNSGSCSAGGASGATLSGGVQATLTLNPCPAGVNGTDTSHSIYLSGGTGTAESTFITGGTCTSGAASGTVIFTPSNSHSGAWTLSSATAGLVEALNSLGTTGGTVDVPAGNYAMVGPSHMNSNTAIRCQRGAIFTMTGPQWSPGLNTYGMFFNVDATFHDFTLEGCELLGNAPQTGIASPGLIGFGPGGITQVANRIVIERNYIHGYAGNGQTPAGGAAVGLLYASGTGNTFRGNTIFGNGIAGGMLTTGPDVLITDNILPGTWSDCGLTINNSTAVGDIVANNTIEGTSICTEFSSASTVANNVIRNPTNYGISLYQVGNDMVVTGNSILGVTTGNNGIQQTAPCPGSTMVVTNNHITRASGSAPNPGSMGLCFANTYQIQGEGLMFSTLSTSPIQFSCTGTPTAGATLFLKYSPISACTNTTEDATTFVLAPAGNVRTLHNLFAYSNGVATHNIVVTARINSADSTLTCTILAGAQTCSDTTHAPSLNPGQPVDAKVVTLAGEVGANNIIVSLEM